MRSRDLFFVNMFIYIYRLLPWCLYVLNGECVLYVLCLVMRLECFHADVRAARPGGASPLDRQAGARFVPQGDDVTGELEENLERFTLEIPYALIDDLQLRYQRPTVGVPGRFRRLLRRVAQALMCYHEHH